MRTHRVVSNRTWGIAAASIVLSVVCLVLIRQSVGTDAEALCGNLPTVLAGAAASLIVLFAALRFDRGEALRNEWLLIGLGMGAIFVGDTIYAYIEVVAQLDVPFPSVADAFWLLAFPLLGAGLLLALLSFRASLSVMKPLAVSFVVCALATAALWTSVFAPILSDTEASGVQKLLAVGYPIGDLWLMAFPALALALALTPLGSGRLAWPWWGLVVGFAGIAAADTAYAVMENAGTYVSGSPIDAGWWLGYLSIAVAASLLVDVQRPIKGGEAS